MATPPATLLLCAMSAFGFVACQHTDYGTPCPELLDGNSPITATGDTTLTNTLTVVGENPNFPCEQLLCVATGGTSGYCTGECLDDSGCPQGFACQQLQGLGSFAGTNFCAWKSCQSVGDCGSASQFCCSSIPGGDPDPNARLCSYKIRGKCS